MIRYPICPECGANISPEDCQQVLDASRNVMVHVYPDACPGCDLAFAKDEEPTLCARCGETFQQVEGDDFTNTCPTCTEEEEGSEDDKCRSCGKVVEGCAGECDVCFPCAVDQTYETIIQQGDKDHA